MANLLQLIQAIGGGGPQMQPEAPAVTAPAAPQAPSSPMDATAAPRITRAKRGGLLGALESVFMPEADTLWAAALRGGIWDAKANQRAYSEGLENNEISQAGARADAQRKARQGNKTVVGNSVYDYDNGTFDVAPQPPTEKQRLIDLWRNTPAGPERDVIERAIGGYQYTPAVIAAQGAARTATAVAGAAARGEQARRTKSTLGASRSVAPKQAKLPSGFILN